jgi:hypothetical protein
LHGQVLANKWIATPTNWLELLGKADPNHEWSIPNSYDSSFREICPYLESSIHHAIKV